MVVTDRTGEAPLVLTACVGNVLVKDDNVISDNCLSDKGVSFCNTCDYERHGIYLGDDDDYEIGRYFEASEEVKGSIDNFAIKNDITVSSATPYFYVNGKAMVLDNLIRTDRWVDEQDDRGHTISPLEWHEKPSYESNDSLLFKLSKVFFSGKTISMYDFGAVKYSKIGVQNCNVTLARRNICYDSSFSHSTITRAGIFHNCTFDNVIFHEGVALYGCTLTNCTFDPLSLYGGGQLRMICCTANSVKIKRDTQTVSESGTSTTTIREFTLESIDSTFNDSEVEGSASFVRSELFNTIVSTGGVYIDHSTVDTVIQSQYANIYGNVDLEFAGNLTLSGNPAGIIKINGELKFNNVNVDLTVNGVLRYGYDHVTMFYNDIPPYDGVSINFATRTITGDVYVPEMAGTKAFDVFYIDGGVDTGGGLVDGSEYTPTVEQSDGSHDEVAYIVTKEEDTYTISFEVTQGTNPVETPKYFQIDGKLLYFEEGQHG